MSRKKVDTYRTIKLNKPNQSHHKSDFELLDLWFDPAIVINKEKLQLLKANDAFIKWADTHKIDIDFSIASLLPLFQPNGQESLAKILKEVDLLSIQNKKRRFKFYLSLDSNNQLTECEITISAFDHLCTTILLIIRPIVKKETNKISQLESALILSENKIKQLLTNSEICSIIFNDTGDIKRMSKSSLKLLNGTNTGKPEKLFANISELIHPADIESFNSLAKSESQDAQETFIRIKSCDDIYLYIKPLGATSMVKYKGSIEHVFLFTDLTEQIKTNDILLATMREYKSIIDASPSAILKANTDGHILFANSEAAHIHGMSRKEIIGKNINNLFIVPNQSFINLLNKKLDLQRKGKGRKILHSIHTTKGQIVTELTYTCIQSQNTKAYLLSYIDITEKEVFKSSLEKSKSKLKSVIDYSTSGIIHINKNFLIEYISETANDLINKDQISIIGSSITSLLSEKSIESFYALIKDIYESDQAESKELLEFKTADEYVQIQVSGKKISNKEDSSIILVCNNYSDKIKSELALIEKESTMHTLLENSQSSIYAVDKNYNVIFINRIAIEDFKKHQDVSIKLGDNLKNKIKPSIFNLWRKTIFNKVFSGDSFNKIGQAPNNHDIILDSKYSPLLDAHGNVNGCIEISRDITTIKRKEYELIEREAYLSSILNSSPNPILVLDNELNITAANPQSISLFNEIHGGKISVNDNLFTKFSANYFEEFKSINERVFNGEIIKYLRTQKVQNNTKYYEYTFSPVKDKHNTIIGSQLLIQDRTQILQSERALMDSEIKHKELLELLPGGILITKMDGNILYASPTMKEMIGIPKYGRLDRESYNSFVIEIQKFKLSFSDIATDKNFTKTFRINTVNQAGQKIWLEARSKEIKFKKEKANLTLLLDITEQVNSEKDRDLKQKLYEVLIDNSFDGIDIIELVTKEDGTFDSKLLMRNERMKEFFNSDSESLFASKSILERAPKFQLNGKLSSKVLLEDIKEFRKLGQLVNERQVIDNSGALRNVIISMQKLSFGNKALIIRYYKDITENKRKENQIKESLNQLNLKNDELEKYIASNLNLENFAHVASHDLKSPLRTIRSFAQLLIKDIYEIIPQKNKTYLDIINKSSKNMSILIDDVLSFSKIESEKLNIKEISCQPFIDFLLTQIKDEIEEYNAEIFLINIPNVIHSDNSKLSQVLQNLIRNSLKFRNKNTCPIIKISVDSLSDFWQFNIEDNGIGIDEKYIHEIFKIFRRLNNKDKFPGSGIGLSTCEKTISILGGKIWVNSIIGQGSIFSFTIPKFQ